MVQLESGFDLFEYQDGGGIGASFNVYNASDVLQDSYSLSLTLTEGEDNLYSHSGFQSYLGDGAGTYPSIADTFQALFDADGLPLDITYSIATGAYTIAPQTAGWKVDMTFPTVEILPLLGFSSNPSRATSLVSDQAVPYWMELTEGCGNYSEDYEQEDPAEIGEARDASNVFHITQPGLAVFMDFSVIAETHQKTFDWYNVAQGSPESYTLQSHFEHARNKHWFMITHDIGTAVHRFTPGGCLFKATRHIMSPPSDDYWNVAFNTYVARAW